MTALEMMLSNGYNWTGDHISIEGSLAEGKNPIQLCSSCSVCPDCQKKLHGENLYNKSDSGEITETTPRNVFKRFRYFINHNSYEFIDIKDFKDDINNAYGLHPLALLLTRGNGRGKTDYIGAAEGHIGAWAGCGISSSNTDPQQFYGSNYTKITFKI